MVRIVGLNKKYFPQSNPLDRILTPQAQAVLNKPTVQNPVARPTAMDSVSYDKPNLLSSVKDMASVIGQGVRGIGRFTKRTYDNRAEVGQELKLGLDLGMKQTTNTILGFLSRPQEDTKKYSAKPLIADWETQIAPKMKEIITKNNKIISETPRSFPTSGLSLADKIKDPRYVFGVGAQQLPNFGAVLGAGLLTGGAGAVGAGFVLESQSAYEDAKSKGVSEKEAVNIGAGVGVVNSLLEVLPVLKFLDGTPVGQQVKKKITQYAANIFLKTGVQALEEGGTEYLQEVTANAFAKVYDENRGLFDNAAESGFFGALTGGGVGAASAVVSPNIGLSIEAKQEAENKIRQLNEAIDLSSSLRERTTNKTTLKQIDRAIKKNEALLIKEYRKLSPSKTPTIGLQIEDGSGLLEEARNYKPVDPITQEALNFKSADEFVKAQGKPVYHGTSSQNARNIDTQGFDIGKNLGATGKNYGNRFGTGFYFTDNPNSATKYAVAVDKTQPTVMDIFINPKAKILSLEAGNENAVLSRVLGKEVTGFEKQTASSRNITSEELTKLLKQKGFDGIKWKSESLPQYNIKSATETTIFDAKNVKTKSQLTDIWKKANKPKAKPVPLQEKISKAETNLQKLGFERDSLDTKFDSRDLENQYQAFKKLVSTQALDKINDAPQLKARIKANPEQVDNMLYSQELTDSEVFDMFKERRFQELGQRGEKGRINREEKVVKKELTKLEKVAKARQEKQDLIDRVKKMYDDRVAKIKDSKQILQGRRAFIKAVQKHFGITDNELKSITRRDIRLMSDIEFKQHLDNIRIKSEQLANRRQAKNELTAQIEQKNLNIEPLRQAMDLPPIHQMTINQLNEFAKVLEQYKANDVFLSKRKLETIHRTELSGIKTYREAREVFNKKHGTDFESLSAGTMDRVTGNVGLSEKNPFYKEMVEDFYKVMLIREQEFVEIERKTLELTKAVVKTKSLTERILHKLIPQQKNIAKWFDAKDKSTVEVNEAEMALIKHIQKHYIDARDYLIKEKQLKHAIDSDNYFTNLRRNFLESVKEDGLITAVKEIFVQQKQDEVQFGITDQKTGVILALEKFFPFALHRSGNLKPSENVVGAFLTYMKAFKKKQAIDATTPLIMTYADAFTPSGTTKNGLGIDTSLQTFTKEWLNNQRGRRAKLLLKQGGPGEFALRLIKQGISLLYLGGNLTVSAATQVGEQAVTFQLLGNKAFVVAKARSHTKKGKRIIAKYESFIGKNPWGQLVEPARKIGDRAMEGIFILFRDANIRRNKQSLLGMMTPEEYASETLSPERLAEIRLAVSRYGMVDGAGSILGATPEFQTALQFRAWATQIMGTSLRNLDYIRSWITSKGTLNKAEAKRALIEIGRVIEVISFVTILSLWGADDEDDDMLSKLKKRAYQEATTVLQGANPFTFATVPPLISFIDQLTKNLKTLAKLEVYTTSKFGEYKKGSLKGLNHLKKQFTPSLVKQFDELPDKTEVDILEKILKDLESGKLNEETGRAKLNSEMKKLKAKQKKERFQLPPVEYLEDLSDRLASGAITEDEGRTELEQYTGQDAEAQLEGEYKDEKSFFGWVELYAQAIGTNPFTVINTVLHDNRIRKIDNGTIIVERNATLKQSGEDIPLNKRRSQEFRKEEGATKEFKADHTMPLQLGGLDTKSNMKLISTEEWERNTPVENYLGDKLRAGLMNHKQVRKLIKEFKDGKITAEEVYKSP